MIFLDTSAAYAAIDVADPNHREAAERLQTAHQQRIPVLTHNYVVLESAALIQRRLGLNAALTFLKDTRLFKIHWITQEDHAEAVELLERRGKRNLSLVDCMSFVVMKRHGVTTALAYDSDFQAEGFNAWV
ncbi:MAG: PIN domain-containing protein [Chloroflexi bacterium]|nr:PIN domain-containing protein [Chloroflexota bacterium]